jgi:hypothetical protein
LFSFVLSLLIVAGSFAIRQSKTILARSYEAVVGFIDWLAQWAIHEDKDTTLLGMNVRMHGFHTSHTRPALR